MLPVGAVDRVIEGPGRVADLPHAHSDVVLVVEAQRRVVAHTRLPDREIQTLREEVPLVDDAELAQVRHAPDLRVEEVIRVIHDALQVRLAEAHTLAVGER